MFAKDRSCALLVGAKLSVEKVLLSFASHMISFNTFEIAIARSYGFNEWCYDLKNIFFKCGEIESPIMYQY